MSERPPGWDRAMNDDYEQRERDRKRALLDPSSSWIERMRQTPDLSRNNVVLEGDLAPPPPPPAAPSEGKGKGKGKGKGTDATLPVARVIGVGKSSPATMYEVLILETQTVVEVPVCCCVPLLVGYEVECVDGRWYKISALYEDACALVLRGHPNEPPKRTPFEELVSVLFHF